MSDRKEFEDWFFSPSNSMSMSDIDVAWDAWQVSAQRPQAVPMTDEQISLEAHNADDRDWNDLRFRSSWHEGFLEGARFAEAHHGITSQAKKETP